MQKSKADITLETYDLIAKDYAKNELASAPKLEETIFIKLLMPGQKILDVGCGFGRNLKAFLEYGLDTYGFDGSKELLKIAKTQASKAKLKLLDLRDRLPYQDKFFDAVWARNSLHHLEPRDLQQSLSELKRVLKPNGIIFIEWKEGKEATITKEEKAFGKERFYNLLSKEEVEELIGDAGFEITNSYIYNSGKKEQFPNFVVIFAKKP
jgi:ubiquinone/menaquinone biosynthesis C-methylase UbiE